MDIDVVHPAMRRRMSNSLPSFQVRRCDDSSANQRSKRRPGVRPLQIADACCDTLFDVVRAFPALEIARSVVGGASYFLRWTTLCVEVLSDNGLDLHTEGEGFIIDRSSACPEDIPYRDRERVIGLHIVSSYVLQERNEHPAGVPTCGVVGR